MDFESILRDAVAKKASDIFIIAGIPISYKINGVIQKQSEKCLTPKDTEALLSDAYKCDGNRDIAKFLTTGDDDFSISIPGLSRFRMSTYKSRGSLSAVIRLIAFGIPDPKEISIPDEVMSVVNKSKGLVLVTGPAGGGKSTTLACVIDKINKTRNNHIITLEDPIEFIHKNNKSTISQREIHTDTEDYVTALRASLRQSPDVILVGEMRDFETIRTAMTAAETGHLIISTLHSVGAANTVDRIIDAFPPNQQQQIRVQLSQLLQTVISQQLIPTVNGKLIPAFEIMQCNGAIRNMIRESKIHQIDNAINSFGEEGMISMDNYLIKLFKNNHISAETAVRYSINPESVGRKINS
ncbi:MAG TPA: type IV pili twitching motility protein PilT [Ruminococcaceae bacterium]|nr:type IV pili twitching motility protein PilT [Oscillospiraceae bacterium]